MNASIEVRELTFADAMRELRYDDSHGNPDAIENAGTLAEWFCPYDGAIKDLLVQQAVLYVIGHTCHINPARYYVNAGE